MQYHSQYAAEDDWDVYFFEKNMQGDVVAVYDEYGTLLIEYSYSAYGKCTYTEYESTSATNNPFRYRGYYFDEGLNLYYLGSRYYDQNTGRFISADAVDVVTATPMGLTDKNLYSYCDNNPVMRVDYDGEFWNFVIGGVVGGIIGGVCAALSGEDIAGIAIAAVAGIASGVVAASGLGMLAQAGISAGISILADVANQSIDIAQQGGDISDFNIIQTGIEGVFGFGSSIAGSALGLVTGRYITKTEILARNAFDSYLGKTFTAGLRSEAGRSTSALMRQANKYLAKTVFWENVTKGVSSCIGSVMVSGPITPLKNLSIKVARFCML